MRPRFLFAVLWTSAGTGRRSLSRRLWCLSSISLTSSTAWWCGWMVLLLLLSLLLFLPLVYNQFKKFPRLYALYKRPAKIFGTVWCPILGKPSMPLCELADRHGRKEDLNWKLKISNSNAAVAALCCGHNHHDTYFCIAWLTQWCYDIGMWRMKSMMMMLLVFYVNGVQLQVAGRSCWSWWMRRVMRGDSVLPAVVHWSPRSSKDILVFRTWTLL